MKSRLLIFASACIFTFSVTPAIAELQARLGGNAYYDSDLDITWVANPILSSMEDPSDPSSSIFGLPYGVSLGYHPTAGCCIEGLINSNGSMTWPGALFFIDAMNSYVNPEGSEYEGKTGYLGLTDWRLPSVSPVNENFNITLSPNGTTDIGSARTGVGWQDAEGNPVSEMGHMYYVNLGNSPNCNPDMPWCTPMPRPWLVNTYPFEYADLANKTSFWTGTVYNNKVFNFDFDNGMSQHSAKSGSGGMWAWPVRTGDVNHPPKANAGNDQTVHVGTLVSLDGSGSHDSDNHYPLTFQWTLWQSDTEITEELSDPTAVDPTFTASQLGNYVAVLTVTDSLGKSHNPESEDSVVISTTNSAPVADAGVDQVIHTVGTLVTLDGRQSYDGDGDEITYGWTLAVPSGSGAALSDPYSAMPSFTADINRDYRATLIVNDGYVDSEEDQVLLSFANVPPVADAGGDQAVVVTERVTLTGSGTDENNDPLTYRWSLVSRPATSSAALHDEDNPTAYFDTDAVGTYVVSLTVNDGIVDSEPDNATIVATTTQSHVISKIREIIAVVNSLEANSFKNNKEKARPLTNKLLAVIHKVELGEYVSASDKLVHDVKAKMDACAEISLPDRNDWIITCNGQTQVYPLIIEVIELLNGLTNG